MPIGIRFTEIGLQFLAFYLLSSGGPGLGPQREKVSFFPLPHCMGQPSCPQVAVSVATHLAADLTETLSG